MQATYVSSNQFRVSTDKTAEFLVGRRIRAKCGESYQYSTIQSSVYSDPNTTVTIEESILTSNLTEVHYGIVNIGDQGSFPNHSHNGDEGTGGEISLLTLSDTPAAYENGEYLRSTTSGIEWVIPEAETVVVRVKEENISTITKGQVCAVVTGSSGVKVEIGLCNCDDPDKIRILGLAQDNILQNEDGIVAYKGVLTNVDTRTTNSDINPNGETWISGDLLWSANTPGGMTNIRPTSGRSIKAARTIKGNSATDALIIISLENPIWNTAAVGEDVVLRVGDSVGANKVSIRNYDNDEVADFDSYGNLTLSGTVDTVDVATLKSDFNSHDHDDRYYTESEVDTISGTLQTDIDTKSDTEVFLTEGTPNASVGKKDDIAIDQNIGTIYKRFSDVDSAGTGTFYPAEQADDGTRYSTTNFTIYNYLTIGRGSSYPYNIFVRFPNVTIPVGSTITNAFIRFTAQDPSSSTVCNEELSFNAVDNAVAPINYTEYDALVKTSAKVDWTAIDVWSTDAQYDSVDIKTPLQEVINRTEWSSGNAVMLLGDGSGSDSGAFRRADVYSGTGKAELHVTWDVPPVWEEKLSPDFLKLSDTPGSYNEGKYLKTTSSGIEFSDDLYVKSEVDTISGTLQTNIDAKPDTELFLTEGVPVNSVGKEDDIALNQETGHVYKRLSDSSESDIFYPVVSGDDGLWRAADLLLSNVDYLQIGLPTSSYRHFFVRCPNITIPQGATINSAFFRFTAYSSQSGTSVLSNIYFNNVDNAVAPTTFSEANGLSLTLPIAWDNLPSWVDGIQYDTPDISSIFQTIIDRTGWSSGNAVQIAVKNDGSSGYNCREISAIDYVSGAEKAELHVTYSAATVWEEKLSPDFLKLSDTPNSYAGIEDNYLRTTASGITTVSGIVLKASDDSEWLISVTTSGILYTTAI